MEAKTKLKSMKNGMPEIMRQLMPRKKREKQREASRSHPASHSLASWPAVGKGAADTGKISADFTSPEHARHPFQNDNMIWL